MDEFGILINRKRAVIALVHSMVFLCLAAWQAMASGKLKGMFASAQIPTGVWILSGIYAIVSSILSWLFAISRGWTEKLYFALCTISATSGFLRIILGDQVFHSARYIRVVMLATAVIVVTFIACWHARGIEHNRKPEIRFRDSISVANSGRTNSSASEVMESKPRSPIGPSGSSMNESGQRFEPAKDMAFEGSPRYDAS